MSPYPTIQDSAKSALVAAKYENCHACGKEQRGGIVTPCSVCGFWGLFCSNCKTEFNDKSCSLTITLCHSDIKPARGTVSSGRDYFSPSQLETYESCQRKWAWHYIDGLPRSTNVYAEFGKKLHSQIEAYLTDGTPFDLTTDWGEAAMAGLHLLPAPGTFGMTVEGREKGDKNPRPFILSGWGHKFLGYKDIQIIQPGSVPIVYDHKSTGDLKWAKTPAELVGNIQAVIYAADAMIKTGSEACDLTWIYYKRTRPFKAKPVSLQVTRADLEPALNQIKILADEMSLIKSSGVRALDLAPNPDACRAYGGCPYIQNCNLSPHDKMVSIMSNQTLEERKNSFMQSLRQAPPGGAGAAVNPPQAGPPQTMNGAPPQFTAPPQQFAPPAHGAQPQNFQPPAQQQPAFQPPPQAQQAPQFTAPPQQQPPPGPPPSPQVDEQVLIQARGVHPNWVAGTPWWNGSAYINQGDPAYPPVFVQAAPPQQAPPGAFPQGQPTGAVTAEAPKRRGRPRKDATPGAPAEAGDAEDPAALAAEGLSRISEGFLFLKKALINGLLD